MRALDAFSARPFVLARLAGAPLIPVFVVRKGVRDYEVRVTGRFEPRTPAESVAALEATSRIYEALVRELPQQWLMFEEVWKDSTAGSAADDYEMVPQAAGFRRR